MRGLALVLLVACSNNTHATSDAPPVAGDSSMTSCAGVCAASPAGWSAPSAVWIGDASSAPTCASTYEGHADLVASAGCSACSCGAAQGGSCALPTTMTADAATCATIGAATAATPFDPSAPWNGACDTHDAIPAGKLCAGVDCVQSLTIAPLTAIGGACASSTSAPLPTSWATLVRACPATAAAGTCASSGTCLATPTAGFATCISHAGDMACPASDYTAKHVAYDDVDTSGLSCSACGCGAVAGAKCTSTISIYTDGACGTLAYTQAADATASCHDLPAGTALGSKSATSPIYTGGVCAPTGGVLAGAAQPTGPTTFCCLP